MGVAVATAGMAVIIFASRSLVVRLHEAAVQTLRPLASWGGSRGRGLRLRVDSFGSGRTGADAGEQEAVALLAAQAAALDRENESLRAMLEIKEEEPQALLISARVWWYGNDAGRESLVIGVGKDRGIRAGDVVTDERRMLVGEVAQVGADFSKVEVASNRGVAFPVSFLPSGGDALARGLGARAFSVELVPESALVRPGDFLVRIQRNVRSNGSVFAGRLTAVSGSSALGFQTVQAILLARPDRLDYVLVTAARETP